MSKGKDIGKDNGKGKDSGKAQTSPPDSSGGGSWANDQNDWGYGSSAQAGANQGGKGQGSDQIIPDHPRWAPQRAGHWTNDDNYQEWTSGRQQSNYYYRHGDAGPGAGRYEVVGNDGKTYHEVVPEVQGAGPAPPPPGQANLNREAAAAPEVHAPPPAAASVAVSGTPVRPEYDLWDESEAARPSAAAAQSFAGDPPDAWADAAAARVKTERTPSVKSEGEQKSWAEQSHDSEAQVWPVQHHNGAHSWDSWAPQKGSSQTGRGPYSH